jgi:hypothetical protein
VTKPSSSKSSCAHLECRLPINLREFLAEQLGSVMVNSDETVLDLAASADAATLSKLARAIRRYSTTRAQQRWEECAVPLTRFKFHANRAESTPLLCLRCVRVDFDWSAAERHQAPACITLAFGQARQKGQRGIDRRDTEIVDALRRAIEEFRRLRTAFGLPHHDLDSYVRNGQVTFTWRPIS